MNNDYERGRAEGKWVWLAVGFSLGMIWSAILLLLGFIMGLGN